ncbi:MAG: aminomethyl-transferring glycine dehydrogenase subunit GcvPB, partial [Candidatus Thermoplasmatota archaeon]|nr:aminomethyl-transferring glycine dehydrogenase subunit GcvPB [Candidatus Thermoplasmatota archaeon]
MYKMARIDEPLLNELGGLPVSPDRVEIPLPPHLQRSCLSLPQMDERTVVRHFTRLSQMNYGVDTGIYPLGSCTMKYTPKVLEKVAHDEHFTHLHPYQDEATVQGALACMY